MLPLSSLACHGWEQPCRNRERREAILRVLHPGQPLQQQRLALVGRRAHRRKPLSLREVFGISSAGTVLLSAELRFFIKHYITSHL